MSSSVKRSSRLFLAPFAVASLLVVGLAHADDDEHIAATFAGNFNLDDGVLSFEGPSTTCHGDLRSVSGNTDLGPGSTPACYAILSDAVTLTADDGSELYIANAGQDCLDFSTGAPVIVGEGTTQVLGGTGRFDHAQGSGTYSVDAPVAELGATTATGTFTLTFELEVQLGCDHGRGR
jgi:hypothetical protein